MALPDKLPVMLAPASAIVLAFSLRLSLIAPIRSMWLPLALRLPVRPPTLPSPMLGLCLVSATEVVSVDRKRAFVFMKQQAWFFSVKNNESYNKRQWFVLKVPPNQAYFLRMAHLHGQLSPA